MVALPCGSVFLRFRSGGHYRGLRKSAFIPFSLYWNLGGWGAALQGSDENVLEDVEIEKNR
jgi:hypothetical protein